MTVFLVACLLWSEVTYFLSPPHKLAFLPDTDFEAKLQINVDMTIAMTCDCRFFLASGFYWWLSLSILYIERN